MTTNSDDPYSIHSGDGAVLTPEHALLRTLGDHPFLKGLTDEQLNILAVNAMPVEFPAGETIFNEGDAANRFYLIQDGEVVLESLNNPERSPVEITRLGSSDVLGCFRRTTGDSAPGPSKRARRFFSTARGFVRSAKKIPALEWLSRIGPRRWPFSDSRPRAKYSSRSSRRSDSSH
jgi:hypothetical protein